jgi:hypothetical protein
VTALGVGLLAIPGALLMCVGSVRMRAYLAAALVSAAVWVGVIAGAVAVLG